MGQVSKYTIRTSGRRTFRRCFRKWGFQSSMRMNLQRKGTETNINFWFGSAIHFAMEDYFGHNRFGDLQRAFQGYYAAFDEADRPNGADEHYFLGLGMLDYFNEWYARQNNKYGFETVWLDEQRQEVPPGTEGARPLVEESFILNLGLKAWVREDTDAIVFGDEQQLLRACDSGDVEYDVIRDQYFLWETATFNPDELVFGQAGVKKVLLQEVPIYYHGTMDRIVKDKHGRWWIMDWKTAKSADTNKLDTDDQISAYLWAAEQWFGHPIQGFVYVQLTKELAKPPKMLANGDISVDKKQKTTLALTRQAIIKKYGDVKKAPNKVIEFLNLQASLESPEGDRYIRWDFVGRTREQKESTFAHILGEAKMMADPHLYLFPNPTRDCIWDCNFREACLMMDNGQDKQVAEWIAADFEQRPREEDGNIDPWRENIPWPDTPQGSAVFAQFVEAVASAETILNIILPEEHK